ncbi:hypothetical protein BV22DRAFT_1022573, partial [Leucogyrophana mollusca]
RLDHHNIMLLAPLLQDSDADSDRQCHYSFCYACVLGIYHANMICTGLGTVDYNLVVWSLFWFNDLRWLRVGTLAILTLSAFKDAFGFVDPADVLRSCHLIPAFSSGKLYPDGVAMSQRAADGQAWAYYYINR